MDDRLVAALEAQVAEAGARLVRLEKYRAGTTAESRALRARLLALGDRARRAHHQGTLGDDAASLLAEARALARAFDVALAAI